jgi:hypothetical protein
MFLSCMLKKWLAKWLLFSNRHVRAIAVHAYSIAGWKSYAHLEKFKLFGTPCTLVHIHLFLSRLLWQRKNNCHHWMANSVTVWYANWSHLMGVLEISVGQYCSRISHWQKSSPSGLFLTNYAPTKITLRIFDHRSQVIFCSLSSSVTKTV